VLFGSFKTKIAGARAVIWVASCGARIFLDEPRGAPEFCRLSLNLKKGIIKERILTSALAGNAPQLNTHFRRLLLAS